MSRLDDGRYLCTCASEHRATRVEHGLLVHEVCGKAMPCDFESGHVHAATSVVGEFNTCDVHKAQAGRAGDDADVED